MTLDTACAVNDPEIKATRRPRVLALSRAMMLAALSIRAMSISASLARLVAVGPDR